MSASPQDYLNPMQTSTQGPCRGLQCWDYIIRHIFIYRWKRNRITTDPAWMCGPNPCTHKVFVDMFRTSLHFQGTTKWWDLGIPDTMLRINTRPTRPVGLRGNQAEQVRNAGSTCPTWQCTAMVNRLNRNRLYINIRLPLVSGVCEWRESESVGVPTVVRIVAQQHGKKRGVRRAHVCALLEGFGRKWSPLLMPGSSAWTTWYLLPSGS